MRQAQGRLWEATAMPSRKHTFGAWQESTGVEQSIC